MLDQALRSRRQDERPAPKPAALRLTVPQIEALVRDYGAGASTYELAQRFGVRRDTVTMHLKRQGVMVRQGPQAALNETGERHVATLYRDGLSIRAIAKRVGISDNTVLKALRSQKVPSRPRHGGVRRRT